MAVFLLSAFTLVCVAGVVIVVDKRGHGRLALLIGILWIATVVVAYVTGSYTERLTSEG